MVANTPFAFDVNPFVQTAPFTGCEHEGGNACESVTGRERVMVAAAAADGSLSLLQKEGMRWVG